MQVVVDPEEFAFALVPLDRKLFIAVESTENFVVVCTHVTFSLKIWKFCIRKQYPVHTIHPDN